MKRITIKIINIIIINKIYKIIKIIKINNSKIKEMKSIGYSNKMIKLLKNFWKLKICWL